jgi:hypothetical protein
MEPAMFYDVSLRVCLVSCVLLLGGAFRADARVTRLQIEQRRPVANGAAMGTVGPYERLDGTAFFEVDPRDPRNALIVNLNKAPTNAKGLVEFRAPFYILKPVDVAKGNGKIWYGINNRGSQTVYSALRDPRATRTLGLEILSEESVSDALLLRKGYAYVDAGWHGDGLPGGFFPQFPIAREKDGSAITGPTRVEWQPQSAAFSLPLLNGFVPYPPASLDTSRATLTVRPRQGAARSTVAASEWAFGTCIRPRQPRSLRHGRLSVRRLRGAEDLRVGLYGQGSDRHGPGLCRDPGRRVLPSERDSRRRRATEPPASNG